MAAALDERISRLSSISFAWHLASERQKIKDSQQSLTIALIAQTNKYGQFQYLAKVKNVNNWTMLFIPLFCG